MSVLRISRLSRLSRLSAIVLFGASLVACSGKISAGGVGTTGNGDGVDGGDAAGGSPDADGAPGNDGGDDAGRPDGGIVDGGIDGGIDGGGVVAKRPAKIDKVDLLLVVANDAQMLDAQQRFATAVPQILASLATSSAAITDVHIGVISSSLGSFGTDACSEAAAGNEENDHGHLLPRNAGEASGSGFSVTATGSVQAAMCPTPVVASAVTWTFGSSVDLVTAEAAASCVELSVGENGCGYRAPWESLYHFLIDPAPYQSATANCTPLSGGVQCDNIAVTGVDSTLLAERAAFLRPDSVLAVVVVSNRNDASLKPAGANWVFWGLPGGTASHGSQMPRGWAACEALPDDYEVEDYTEIEAKGCYWCYNNSSDPNCDINLWTATGSTDWDQRNVREFNQTQRYGINGLYARSRYVDAFTQAEVIGSDGNLNANPIFAGGQRTPDMIVVSAIVGTPESLVADPTTHAPRTLAESDWDKLVAPDHTIRDPHMIESITPRAGLAPFKPSASSDVLAIPPDFTDPINGGDRAIPDTSDLQYACIGVRATTTPDPNYPECTASAATSSTNPLCGVDATGAVTQPRFAAYPGLRHLRILHEIELTGAGVTTVVGSICADSYAPIAQGIAAAAIHAVTTPAK